MKIKNSSSTDKENAYTFSGKKAQEKDNQEPETCNRIWRQEVQDVAARFNVRDAKAILDCRTEGLKNDKVYKTHLLRLGRLSSA